MMSVLTTSNLTLTYGKDPVISELNLHIPKGKITVFIGSNGCGKSTLLRSLARLLNPKSGHVLLNGKDIAKRSTKQVAKELAILPQGPAAPEGLTVLQLVKQGRFPYQSWLRHWSPEDERAVMDALKATNLLPFMEKPVDSLSGGQRQRAWIAMTLAQGTETILLDEPTTYLDMTHQVEILDLLFELNEKEKRTIVMVLHDLNLACRYADHIVAIADKTIYAQGTPEKIMTGQMVEAVFNMKCTVVPDPVFGTPMCIPFGKGRVVKNVHSPQYA
jgi:iron complex transport system ATP-binding protein